MVVTNQRKQTDKVFKAYGGYTLNIAGVFETEIKIGNRTGMCEFYVIEGTGKLLIGDRHSDKRKFHSSDSTLPQSASGFRGGS